MKICTVTVKYQYNDMETSNNDINYILVTHNSKQYKDYTNIASTPNPNKTLEIVLLEQEYFGHRNRRSRTLKVFNVKHYICLITSVSNQGGGSNVPVDSLLKTPQVIHCKQCLDVQYVLCSVGQL